MTSAYYLRYGGWNAPSLLLDNVSFVEKESGPIIVTPVCKVVHLTDASITINYDTSPVLSKLSDAHQHVKPLLLPSPGCFKATVGTYTVLDHQYSVCDSCSVALGSIVKLKYFPVLRRIASGETRCDLNVFDILLLENE